MTEALDKVLNNVDRLDRTVKLAISWGATPELAEVFAAKYAAQFEWNGVNLLFGGKVATDDVATKKHFTEGALKPLFPASETNKDAPTIPPNFWRMRKLATGLQLVPSHG